MLVIALTGGIGSGKSTISDIFKSKNVPVIDTDVIARKLADKGTIAYQKIINAFGIEILKPDKEIDRKFLRQLVFSSKEKRLQLEKILHPLIWDEVRSQISKIDSPYTIVVVPLLLENKNNINELTFDRIVVVDIKKELQIKRVKKRDDSDESIIENIISSQVPRETRLAAADDIIENSSNLENLQQKIEDLHQYYLDLSC